MGPDYSWNFEIAGVYRDFQVGSALDEPTSAMLLDVGDYDRWNKTAITRPIRGTC